MFSEAVYMSRLPGHYYMIQHLYVQKVSAFQKPSCDIPVLLTGLQTAAGVIVDLCIVFSYEKSAPELLKNQCVQ
jgi:hypothetical protein